MGTGPRDGLMTGLHERTGQPVGRVRLYIELTVLTIGWLMGGTVGVGTVMFGALIGQSVAVGLGIVAVHMQDRCVNVSRQGSAIITGSGIIEIRPDSGSNDLETEFFPLSSAAETKMTVIGTGAPATTTPGATASPFGGATAGAGAGPERPDGQAAPAPPKVKKYNTLGKTGLKVSDVSCGAISLLRCAARAMC